MQMVVAFSGSEGFQVPIEATAIPVLFDQRDLVLHTQLPPKKLFSKASFRPLSEAEPGGQW
jgi:hypothetical protein